MMLSTTSVGSTWLKSQCVWRSCTVVFPWIFASIRSTRGGGLVNVVLDW